MKTYDKIISNVVFFSLSLYNLLKINAQYKMVTENCIEFRNKDWEILYAPITVAQKYKITLYAQDYSMVIMEDVKRLLVFGNDYETFAECKEILTKSNIEKIIKSIKDKSNLGSIYNIEKKKYNYIVWDFETYIVYNLG